MKGRCEDSVVAGVSGVWVEGGRHEGMKGDEAVRGQVGGGGSVRCVGV